MPAVASAAERLLALMVAVFVLAVEAEQQQRCWAIQQVAELMSPQEQDSRGLFEPVHKQQSMLPAPHKSLMQMGLCRHCRGL